MEVSALKHPGVAGTHGRSPLLRLQSDERLIALVRRGNHGAFEVLVSRYQARLLAFCRHMLGSREDAEDVLQEVFAAAFNAILADERPINARPWLYRIARNRSLNHLRRVQPIGVDSMDVHLSEHGATTADKVHKREEFRELIADVQDLPETQRTALLLREIDALSYEQIAEAMETTIPSVKSLLVRARVSLAEAAQARQLSCDEVRVELGELAEGLRRRTSAPVRRHLRGCERCGTFRKQLRATNKALAAVMPVGAVLVVKKLVLAHLGLSASAGGHATGTAAAGGAAAAGAAAGTATSGLVSAGLSAVATKAAAGIAAAALVTAGAVEIEQTTPHHGKQHAAKLAKTPPAPRSEGPVIRQAPARVQRALSTPTTPAISDAKARHAASTKPSALTAREQAQSDPQAQNPPGTGSTSTNPSTATTPTNPAPPSATTSPAGQTQVESSTTTLPSQLPSTPPSQTLGTPPPATTTSAPPPPATTTSAPPPPATTTSTTPPPATTTNATTPPTATPRDAPLPTSTTRTAPTTTPTTPAQPPVTRSSTSRTDPPAADAYETTTAPTPAP